MTSFSPHIDAYFEARRAFVDCPEVRIRTLDDYGRDIIRIECSREIAGQPHFMTYAITTHEILRGGPMACQYAAEKARREWPRQLGEELLTGRHELKGPRQVVVAPMPAYLTEMPRVPASRAIESLQEFK